MELLDPKKNKKTMECCEKSQVFIIRGIVSVLIFLETVENTVTLNNYNNGYERTFAD